jgi:hypothetical protein
MKNQITERALACLNATNEAMIRSDYRDEAFSTVENTFPRSAGNPVPLRAGHLYSCGFSGFI